MATILPVAPSDADPVARVEAAANAAKSKKFDHVIYDHQDDVEKVIIRVNRKSAGLDLSGRWSILLPHVLKKGAMVSLCPFDSTDAIVRYVAVDELSRSIKPEWRYATFLVYPRSDDGVSNTATEREDEEGYFTPRGAVVMQDTQRLHFRLYDKDFNPVVCDWFTVLHHRKS